MILRRLWRNPLVPLLLIASLVLFLALRPSSETENLHVQMQAMRPVGKGFEDARRVLTALQLMDENRLEDAVTILQPLSESPVRLSAWIVSIRGGGTKTRAELIELIDRWLLAQADSHANAFPSENTPTMVLDFIAEVTAYYETQPTPQRAASDEAILTAMFQRTSIERKLRLLEKPAHLRGVVHTPPIDAPSTGTREGTPSDVVW